MQQFQPHYRRGNTHKKELDLASGGHFETLFIFSVGIISFHLILILDWNQARINSYICYPFFIKKHMKMIGVKGLTEVEKILLKALGGVENNQNKNNLK